MVENCESKHVGIVMKHYNLGSNVLSITTATKMSITNEQSIFLIWNFDITISAQAHNEHKTESI